MALYNFTLTLSGVTAHTVGLEDALHAAGCADALVCFYGTAVYLEFDRECDSLEQAILSAIANIESAPPLNARVESVDSALVGLSDIAELTGLTHNLGMVAGDFRVHIVRITRPSQLVGAVFTGMEFTHDVCRARKVAAVVVLAEGREQDDQEFQSTRPRGARPV